MNKAEAKKRIWASINKAKCTNPAVVKKTTLLNYAFNWDNLTKQEKFLIKASHAVLVWGFVALLSGYLI